MPLTQTLGKLLINRMQIIPTDFKSLGNSTLSANNNSVLEDHEIPDTEILRNFQQKMDEKGGTNR